MQCGIEIFEYRLWRQSALFLDLFKFISYHCTFLASFLPSCNLYFEFVSFRFFASFLGWYSILDSVIFSSRLFRCRFTPFCIVWCFSRWPLTCCPPCSWWPRWCSALLRCVVQGEVLGTCLESGLRSCDLWVICSWSAKCVMLYFFDSTWVPEQALVAVVWWRSTIITVSFSYLFATKALSLRYYKNVGCNRPIDNILIRMCVEFRG